MSSSLVDSPVFEALLRPYRSLSARGIGTIVIAVLVLTGIFCLRFWLIGAWPVMIFSLADIPIVALLLAINIRRARATELLILTEYALTVTRTDAGGSRQLVSLPTAWLRVDLHNQEAVPRIMLYSQGQGFEVGAFLHEPDKRALYEALKTALHGVRNPTFDNPQLRGC